jgi:phosphate transport system permease protein
VAIGVAIGRLLILFGILGLAVFIRLFGVPRATPVAGGLVLALIVPPTIISMAQALGETAPLLMIGMVAFIAESPDGFTDPAASLPVQIYLWSTSPEWGYLEKTAAAIIALLVFLLLMNALAIWLRLRTQRKW